MRRYAPVVVFLALATPAAGQWPSVAVPGPTFGPRPTLVFPLPPMTRPGGRSTFIGPLDSSSVFWALGWTDGRFFDRGLRGRFLRPPFFWQGRFNGRFGFAPHIGGRFDRRFGPFADTGFYDPNPFFLGDPYFGGPYYGPMTGTEATRNPYGSYAPWGASSNPYGTYAEPDRQEPPRLPARPPQ